MILYCLTYSILKWQNTVYTINAIKECQCWWYTMGIPRIKLLAIHFFGTEGFERIHLQVSNQCTHWLTCIFIALLLHPVLCLAHVWCRDSRWSCWGCGRSAHPCRHHTPRKVFNGAYSSRGTLLEAIPMQALVKVDGEIICCYGNF